MAILVSSRKRITFPVNNRQLMIQHPQFHPVMYNPDYMDAVTQKVWKVQEALIGMNDSYGGAEGSN